jgi:dolichol-phosphate mannosyltransferase
MTTALAVVMPVYNEEACIARVVRSWLGEIEPLNVPFAIIVLNDGSRDGTQAALAEFESDPRVKVIDKPNSGHGPTVLQGYRAAVTEAEWVFQCDSDDEIKPRHFPEFWARRSDCDAVLGVRTGRDQALARKICSAGARLAVRLLYGPGVEDVNVPYRLMRSDVLKQIVEQMPDDTLTPNLVISGALARAGAKICNIPVEHENRQTGSVSIARLKLWRVAFRALRQVVRCRRIVKLEPSRERIST